MAEKPVLHLEELNLKYEGEKPAKYAYRARIAGGWLIFICTPGRGGGERRHVLPRPGPHLGPGNPGGP